MRNLIFLSLISSALLLSGCTNKRVEKAKHEPPLKVEVYQTPDLEVASENQIEKLNVVSLEAKLNKTTSAQALLNDIVEPLRQNLLNANVLENPDIKGREKLEKLLTVFNKAIVKLLQLQPDLVTKPVAGRKESLLDEYFATVASGCRDDLTECRNISFFRDDNESRTIVFQKVRQYDSALSQLTMNGQNRCVGAECMETVGMLLKVQLIVLNLTRMARDPQVELMYIKWAREIDLYFNYIMKLAAEDYSDEGVARLKRIRMAMGRHWRIFARLMIDFTNGSLPENIKSNLNDFLDRFSGFAVSGSLERIKVDDAQLEGDFKRALEMVKVEFYRRRAFVNGRLNPAVLENLKNIEAQGSSDHPSFQWIIQDLQTRYPRLFHNLSLQDAPQLPVDQYYLIASQLMRGQISQDIAGEIWRSIVNSQNGSQSQEQAEFLMLRAIETFSKVFIAHQIVATNEYFKSFFDNPVNRRGSTIFNDAIVGSRERSNSWQTVVKTQLEQLNIFIKRNIAPRYPKLIDDSVGAKEFRRVQTLMEGIPRIIKYISVYDNMQKLSYFMSKNGGTISIYIWFLGRSISFPADIIIKSIFLFYSEKLKNYWFDFANETSTMNRLEVLLSFYLGLLSESFESYRGKAVDDESAMITESKFFIEIMKNLLNELTAFEPLTADIDRSMRSSNFRNMVESACYQPDQEVSANFFTDLEDSVLVQTNTQRQKGLVWEAMNVYGKTSDQLFKSLVTLHFGHRVRLNFVETMTKLLAVYKENSKLSDSEKTRLEGEIKKINAELDQYKAKTQNFLSAVVAYHAQTQDCMNQIAEFEVERLYKIVDREQRNAQDLHAAMTLLKLAAVEADEVRLSQLVNGGSTSEALNAEWEKISQQNTPEEAQALRSRMARVLARAQQFPSGTLLAKLNALFDIQDEDIRDDKGQLVRGFDVFNSSVAMLHKFDLLARTKSYLRDPELSASRTIVDLGPNWHLEEIYKRPEPYRAPYRENVQEFVRQYMVMMNGKRGSFVNWFAMSDETSFGAGHLLGHLKTSAQLYRMGEMELPASACEGAKGFRLRPESPKSIEYRVTESGKCIASVPARSLILEAKRVVEHYRISAKDQEVLTLLSRDQKFDETKMKGILIDDKTQVPMPAFEFLYSSVAVGEFEDGPFPEILESEGYFVSHKNLGVMLYPIGEKAEGEIRRAYRPIAMQFLSRVNQFNDELAKFESENPEFLQNCVNGINPDNSTRSCAAIRELNQPFATLKKSTSESFVNRQIDFFKRSRCENFAKKGEEGFGYPLFEEIQNGQSCEAFVDERFKL